MTAELHVVSPPPSTISAAEVQPPLQLARNVTTAGVDSVAAEIKSLAAGAPMRIFYLGRQPYRPVWALQKRLHAWRVAGSIPDVVLLLEHEPVYTLGKNADPNHLLSARPADAEVVRSDRGGAVTYHGPGQLVGYPIVNLKAHRPSVSWYLRGLEEVIIGALGSYGVAAGREEGLTGVWIRRRKVAALGVRLARWTATHGFAINVQVPARYFDGLIPCGLLAYGVANLNDFLAAPTDVWMVARRVSSALHRFLGGRHGEVPRLHQSPAA